MTTGPDHEPAATRGHIRAGHADREHALTVLKAAFVQGRLTKDELESRIAQAFTAKTFADLAMLTADIPAAPGLPAAAVPDTLPSTGPTAPAPASTSARTLGIAARRSGICLLTMVALIEGAVLTGNAFFFVLASFAFMAASGFIGYGIIDARQQRRSSQPPSPPGRKDRGLRDGRPARPGPDPAPPDLRADRTRTELRARRARADLRADSPPIPTAPARSPAPPERPSAATARRAQANQPEASRVTSGRPRRSRPGGGPQPTLVPLNRLDGTVWPLFSALNSSRASVRFHSTESPAFV